MIKVDQTTTSFSHRLVHIIDIHISTPTRWIITKTNESAITRPEPLYVRGKYVFPVKGQDIKEIHSPGSHDRKYNGMVNCYAGLVVRSKSTTPYSLENIRNGIAAFNSIYGEAIQRGNGTLKLLNLVQ